MNWARQNLANMGCILSLLMKMKPVSLVFHHCQWYQSFIDKLVLSKSVFMLLLYAARWSFVFLISIHTPVGTLIAGGTVPTSICCHLHETARSEILVLSNTNQMRVPEPVLSMTPQVCHLRRGDYRLRDQSCSERCKKFDHWTCKLSHSKCGIRKMCEHISGLGRERRSKQRVSELERGKLNPESRSQPPVQGEGDLVEHSRTWDPLSAC
jgi:hypothetical protein